MPQLLFSSARWLNLNRSLTLASISLRETPAYGMIRVASSYMTIAKLKTSERSLKIPSNVSGALQAKVPTPPYVLPELTNSLERPKSATLHLPEASRTKHRALSLMSGGHEVC